VVDQNQAGFMMMKMMMMMMMMMMTPQEKEGDDGSSHEPALARVPVDDFRTIVAQGRKKDIYN
jgi:hypothetical protein